MDNLSIDATERSPEIEFNFQAGTFALRGESFPENVTEFFGPIIEQLEEYLGGLSDGEVTFDFEMIYFNSSTAKILMGLFDMLDETAGRGVSVEINWRYEADDDNMEELGEDFSEDLEKANFNLIAVEE